MLALNCKKTLPIRASIPRGRLKERRFSSGRPEDKKTASGHFDPSGCEFLGSALGVSHLIQPPILLWTLHSTQLGALRPRTRPQWRRSTLRRPPSSSMGVSAACPRTCSPAHTSGTALCQAPSDPKRGYGGVVALLEDVRGLQRVNLWRGHRRAVRHVLLVLLLAQRAVGLALAVGADIVLLHARDAH